MEKLIINKAERLFHPSHSHFYLATNLDVPTNLVLLIIFLEQITELRKALYLWLKFYYSTAAKSLQSCPIVCDPIDGSPPGSPIPGILQARTLEWVAISFSSA